jgi:Zn-dependent peptidase ImmA (M78 family)
MTTNTYTRTEQSVLALLRGLVPKRPLSHQETLRIAELQANRLLQHFQIQTTAVPSELIADLPRVRIDFELLLPVSGAAHWSGRYWVISLNAADHPSRQRFSLAHEFKHIVDHVGKDYLYADRPHMSAHEQAEKVADYFAGCLLMPKRVLKRLWGEGHQDSGQLADLLDVSTRAITVRLDQLGLTEPRSRCHQPVHATTMTRGEETTYART